MIKYYVRHKEAGVFIYELFCYPADTTIWQLPPGTTRYRVSKPNEFCGDVYHNNFLYDNEYDARAAAIDEIRTTVFSMSKGGPIADDQREIFKKTVLIKTILLNKEERDK
jgi:hypothetical protein